ncbi:hypothetical protein K402DRAFT_393722 [Aulographum hederae CBS 113979]|uniref:Uncharacterized protein n=1 Tax=Aulographum hederae CBS 113979 TaxID=1176131 RepID=A0A6G1H0V2_9PEZI|nr:hypothetical protein K402DRAFT_393722 [Aulographum hederae CBS 113979]
MARPIVTIAKFVGTISLGLLTGLHSTLSSLTLPTLLTLPSAALAARTHNYLTITSKTHIRLLTYLSVFSPLVAYAFSPARGRHPYLLWTSLVAGCGPFAVDALLDRADAARAMKVRGSQSPKQKMSASRISDDGVMVGESEEEPESGEEDVNGEEVREKVEKMQVREWWRAGVSGLAFAMGVVGVWGDRHF